jgi:hypothetical protein
MPECLKTTVLTLDEKKKLAQTKQSILEKDTTYTGM